MSPALAGGFSTTAPPGKPQLTFKWHKKDIYVCTHKDKAMMLKSSQLLDLHGGIQCIIFSTFSCEDIHVKKLGGGNKQNKNKEKSKRIKINKRKNILKTKNF